LARGAFFVRSFSQTQMSKRKLEEKDLKSEDDGKRQKCDLSPIPVVSAAAAAGAGVDATTVTAAAASVKSKVSHDSSFHKSYAAAKKTKPGLLLYSRENCQYLSVSKTDHVKIFVCQGNTQGFVFPGDKQERPIALLNVLPREVRWLRCAFDEGCGFWVLVWNSERKQWFTSRISFLMHIFIHDGAAVELKSLQENVFKYKKSDNAWLTVDAMEALLEFNQDPELSAACKSSEKNCEKHFGDRLWKRLSEEEHWTGEVFFEARAFEVPTMCNIADTPCTTSCTCSACFLHFRLK
jgi:hypothetical protein